MEDTTRELRRYVENHMVSNMESAKDDMIPVVKDIAQKIERKDSRFKIGEIEYTGSIYQKLKIDDPDEFDFDLPLLELEIDKIDSYMSQEYAYYKLQPQQAGWRNLADGNGKLSSERVVQTFASYVSMAVAELNSEGKYKFLLDLKTDHPAVTIKFKQGGKVLYNVDLVPVIKVKSWPDNLTQGWESRRRNGWPSAHMIKQIKRSGVNLVPKLPTGVNIPQRNVAWRFSFNNAEKMLLLDGRPAIANNCRRPVLRILKSLRVDYKWPEIRSYHLKTVMLHEFESHQPSHWTIGNMLPCLQKALERLKVFLQNRNCPHYFLPGINLFERFNIYSCERIIRDIDEFKMNPKQALEALNSNLT